ncbi:MAG: alginate lyase family protein [Candidatus Hydrogenedentes bacterium]|nr:alginate lyase family protein [Candidatus Hydrogenedentota bacterium]
MSAPSRSSRLIRLFDALDLDRIGLAGVRDAVVREDGPAATRALMDYYRHAVNPAFPSAAEKPQRDEATIARADAVLNDTFTFYDQTAKVPRRPDGGLQWDYTGPANDNEWAWALNRHFHLNWLLDAYLMTGDAKYAAAWDAHVNDWIVHNPYAEPNQNPLVWRGLETFFRVRAWARGFYALQDEPALTADTRILMLSSIPDHARYLREFHKSKGNWVAMEMNGLATAGVAWPEFRDAAAWIDYSVERLTAELSAQVYPDGAQMELTASYHRVTLGNFQAAVDLLQPTGRELPRAFRETIERMWDYLAYTLQPNGFSPLNNDSDLDQNGPRLLAQAETFNRPDWAYIASNESNGAAPDGLPSRAFPWAGQLVMRSGWNRDAQWAFFDAGPMGIGHYHADKLHLSVSAYGRDILVDAGRYTYVGGDWRKYFTGSASHNVILIDGLGQKNHPLKAEVPIGGQFVTVPEYDLGYGKFDSGFAEVEGAATHERLVYYLRGGYWIVVDRITTDRPRRITALWHFHPDCTVAVDGQTVASTDADAGNVRIVPSNGEPWDVSLVSGQETPAIQGWWSREYNHRTPSPAVVCERGISESVTFAWLILPAKGVPPKGALTISLDGNRVSCDVEVSSSSYSALLELGESPALIHSRMPG